jgi:predicted Zn-dependent protease
MAERDPTALTVYDVQVAGLDRAFWLNLMGAADECRVAARKSGRVLDEDPLDVMVDTIFKPMRKSIGRISHPDLLERRYGLKVNADDAPHTDALIKRLLSMKKVMDDDGSTLPTLVEQLPSPIGPEHDNQIRVLRNALLEERAEYSATMDALNVEYEKVRNDYVGLLLENMGKRGYRQIEGLVRSTYELLKGNGGDPELVKELEQKLASVTVDARKYKADAGKLKNAQKYLQAAKEELDREKSAHKRRREAFATLLAERDGLRVERDGLDELVRGMAAEKERLEKKRIELQKTVAVHQRSEGTATERIAAYRGLLAKDPQNPLLYTLVLKELMDAANGKTKNENRKSASVLLGKLERLGETSVVVNLAELYVQEGNDVAAMFMLRSLTENKSSNPRVYDSLADIVGRRSPHGNVAYVKVLRRQAKRRAVEKVLRDGQKSEAEYVTLVETLYDANEYELVHRKMKEADVNGMLGKKLSVYVDKKIVNNYGAGVRSVKGSKYANARKQLRRVVILQSGNINEATVEHTRALKAQFWIAESYLREGKQSDARVAFRKLLSLPEIGERGYNHAQVHYRLGVSLQKEGKRRAAKIAFKAAVGLDPKHEAKRYLSVGK